MNTEYELLQKALEALDYLVTGYDVDWSACDCDDPTEVIRSYLAVSETKVEVDAEMEARKYADPESQLDWSMPENLGATAPMRGHFRAGLARGLEIAGKKS